jgi:hypothetical protein
VVYGDKWSCALNLFQSPTTQAGVQFEKKQANSGVEFQLVVVIELIIREQHVPGLMLNRKDKDLFETLNLNPNLIHPLVSQ